MDIQIQERSQEISIKRIMEMLPHRFPFLLVDRVVAIDLEKNTIECIKNVTINESFFQGHFPGEPIMPGVLTIEALAQAGGILVYEKGYTELKVLSTVKMAKFRRSVVPGDQLRLCVEALHISSRGAKIKGKAFVGQSLACEAEIVYTLMQKS
jgi:3-hydroxyacyl-[acyl-carrier-protein] dehydratase